MHEKCNEFKDTLSNMVFCLNKESLNNRFISENKLRNYNNPFINTPFSGICPQGFFDTENYLHYNKQSFEKNMINSERIFNENYPIINSKIENICGTNSIRSIFVLKRY
jgi:hypothetical protein